MNVKLTVELITDDGNVVLHQVVDKRGIKPDQECFDFLMELCMEELYK